MALDPYDPCPCGSGKKLKFCCADIAHSIEQVNKLREAKQFEASMKKLESLNEKFPDNLWVATQRADLFLESGHFEEVKKGLRSLLQKNPDHSLALVQFAHASLNLDGFEKSRGAIHRSFQKSARKHPLSVGMLAMMVATDMASRSKYMATRQHLVLALQIIPERLKHEIFQYLHRFDSDGGVPYPLRSVHHLADEHLEGDAASDAHKARRLTEIGCFGPAAKIYTRLTVQFPGNAAIWQNLGLCYAWDGEHQKAAEALHTAAKSGDGSLQSIECETIAQILDLDTSEDRIKTESWRMKFDSLSRVLTILSEDSRIFKVLEPGQQQEDQEDGPDALCQILDRSTDGIELTDESSLDDVPRVTANIALFDSEENSPAFLDLSEFSGPELAAALEYLKELLGDQVKQIERLDDPDSSDSIAREEFVLLWRWHCPPETPAIVRKSLEQQQWNKVLSEVWTNTPQQAFGGKTPLEVSADQDCSTALIASLFVLDAFCSRNEYLLDFEKICARLNVEAPALTKVDADTPIAHFTALQLKQIDISTLADEQLVYVANRALLLSHGEFLYSVLEQVLVRPNCSSKFELNEVYLALVDLSVEKYRRDLAFEWLAKAQDWAKTQEKSFELTLQWKMRELSLRLEDPADEKRLSMFQEIWKTYGKKVPDLHEYLSFIAKSYQIPFEDSNLVLPGSEASATEGGVWTPGATSEQPAGGEGKTLWVPGQD